MHLASFHFFSVIDGLDWFLIGSLYKDGQLVLLFLKHPSLVLCSSYYINDLPADGVCVLLSVLLLLSTLKCDQVSDLWQQLELASELELTYETW